MFPRSVSLRRVSFCADTRMFDEQIHFSRHSVSILSLLCVWVLILCSLAKFMVFGDVCHKSEEIESGVLAGLRDLVENKSTELRCTITSAYWCLLSYKNGKNFQISK